jgi:hypothetical protein
MMTSLRDGDDDEVVRLSARLDPTHAAVYRRQYAVYRRQYSVFKELYPRTADLMKLTGEMGK